MVEAGNTPRCIYIYLYILVTVVNDVKTEQSNHQDGLLALSSFTLILRHYTDSSCLDKLYEVTAVSIYNLQQVEC